MDTFMDKLAQKLTAQEMIKANNEADAEEMSRLRARTEKYEECLDKLTQLVDESVNKIEGAQVDNEEINRLVETGIAKIESAQVDTEEINRLVETGIARIENAQINTEEINRLVENGIARIENAQINTGEIDRLVEAGLAKIESAQVNGEEINRLVATSMTKIYEIQSNAELQLNVEMQQTLEELKTQLAEKLQASNESVHRECVKVYRNVQAAMVDENTKQTESITNEISTLGSKMTVIFGASVAALVFSVIAVILQLLSMF